MKTAKVETSEHPKNKHSEKKKTKGKEGEEKEKKKKKEEKKVKHGRISWWKVQRKDRTFLHGKDER